MLEKRHYEESVKGVLELVTRIFCYKPANLASGRETITVIIIITTIMAIIRMKLKTFWLWYCYVLKSFNGSQIPVTAGEFGVRILASLFVFF